MHALISPLWCQISAHIIFTVLWYLITYHSAYMASINKNTWNTRVFISKNYLGSSEVTKSLESPKYQCIGQEVLVLCKLARFHLTVTYLFHVCGVTKVTLCLQTFCRVVITKEYWSPKAVLALLNYFGIHWSFGSCFRQKISFFVKKTWESIIKKTYHFPKLNLKSKLIVWWGFIETALRLWYENLE